MLYLPHPSVDGILKTNFFFFFFFVNATDNGDLVEIILNLLTEIMMLRQVKQLCKN